MEHKAGLRNSQIHIHDQQRSGIEMGINSANYGRGIGKGPKIPVDADKQASSVSFCKS